MTKRRKGQEDRGVFHSRSSRWPIKRETQSVYSLIFVLDIFIPPFLGRAVRKKQKGTDERFDRSLG